MKLRKEHAIRPVTLAPGDSMTVTYTEYFAGGSSRKTVLMDQQEIGVEMTCDAVAIIELEVDDLDGRRGIGGILLEER